MSDDSIPIPHRVHRPGLIKKGVNLGQWASFYRYPVRGRARKRPHAHSTLPIPEVNALLQYGLVRLLPLAQVKSDPAEDHDDPVHHKEQDDHAEGEFEHNLAFFIRRSSLVARRSYHHFFPMVPRAA